MWVDCLSKRTTDFFKYIVLYKKMIMFLNWIDSLCAHLVEYSVCLLFLGYMEVYI